MDSKILKRIIDFNPFRQVTKEDDLKRKEEKAVHINELKELSDIAEELSSDSRYQKIRKLRQEQLEHNIYLLKTTVTTDPKIAELQAVIDTLEEELNMPKVIKEMAKKIEDELYIEAQDS